MAEAKPSYSIQGGWLGAYFYTGAANQPCSFEAVFVESSGRVSGNILDYGNLGEADVTGKFAYPDVVFTKTYRSRSLEPVRYQGTMSEDGKTMSGTWRLPGGLYGTWRARRMDAEESLEDEFCEWKAKAEEEEKEAVVEPARSR